MSVTIKSAEEIELMRQAGKYLAKVHQELERAIKPGISTWEIDKIGEETIRSLGCEPNFLNYQGYPASVCVSVNDEVVHGIPRKDHIIKEGDIVSLDTKKLLYLVTHFIRPRLSTEDTSFKCKLLWLYAHFLYSFTYISGI